MRTYVLQPEPQRLANYRSYAEQARRTLGSIERRRASRKAPRTFAKTAEAARAFVAQLDKIVDAAARRHLCLGRTKSRWSRFARNPA